jgi:hypothetical protein
MMTDFEGQSVGFMPPHLVGEIRFVAALHFLPQI